MDRDIDIDILARTIYGEARGECHEGQLAVGLVILNRYVSKKWFAGKTVADTCLKARQFSCWNAEDPNSEKIKNLSDSELSKYKAIASYLLANMECIDITNGATHYHTKKINPVWARGKKPCAVIGNHIFYKNID